MRTTGARMNQVILLLSVFFYANANPLTCGLCTVQSEVADCRSLFQSCIKIIRNGQVVRDVLVSRCGQDIIPANLKMLARYSGRLCYHATSTTTTPTPTFILTITSTTSTPKTTPDPTFTFMLTTKSTSTTSAVTASSSTPLTTSTTSTPLTTTSTSTSLETTSTTSTPLTMTSTSTSPLEKTSTTSTPSTSTSTSLATTSTTSTPSTTSTSTPLATTSTSSTSLTTSSSSTAWREKITLYGKGITAETTSTTSTPLTMTSTSTSPLEKTSTTSTPSTSTSLATTSTPSTTSTSTPLATTSTSSTSLTTSSSSTAWREKITLDGKGITAGSHEQVPDGELFEQPATTGFLAWAAVTTLCIIAIVIKRLLREKCNCECTNRTPPSPQNPTYTPSCSPSNFEMHVLHTPPSQTTSPSTSNASSCKPLISPKTVESESPVASRTRTKTPRKLSFVKQ